MTRSFSGSHWTVEVIEVQGEWCGLSGALEVVPVVESGGYDTKYGLRRSLSVLLYPLSLHHVGRLL